MTTTPTPQTASAETKEVKRYTKYVLQDGDQSCAEFVEAADYDSLRHVAAGMEMTIEELIAERDKAQTDLAAALVDARRLDWLEREHANEIGYDYIEEDEEFRWRVFNVLGINDREWTLLGEGKTLREAIDAATGERNA